MRCSIKLKAPALLFGAVTLCAQNRAAADPWEPLRFLVGTWEAKTEGGAAGAASSGTYTFQLELRGRVLARHAVTADCKGPASYDCEHTDLLYVYPERDGLRAMYFDNEGHVIHYEVTTSGPNTAVFLTPAAQPGPQFRLIYELTAEIMRGKFQMRPPGQSDFKSYLEWSGRKKTIPAR